MPKKKSRRKSTKNRAAAARAARYLEIVAEGDSWERLPDWGPKGLPIVGGSNSDLCRALTDRGHTVHNLAYWGDTIAAIAEVGEFIPALRSTRARYLLLGGGGNDLLGEGKLKTYLRLFDIDRTRPEDYILDVFYRDLRQVILHYESILSRIAADSKISSTKVIVHGYDYAQPMRLGWLGEPFEFVGLDGFPKLENGIVKILIDSFNRELEGLATRHPNVIRVDFRGKVGNRWHDELHPSREAFAQLGAMVERAILSTI
jgi:hypothetical protein